MRRCKVRGPYCSNDDMHLNSSRRAFPGIYYLDSGSLVISCVAGGKQCRITQGGGGQHAVDYRQGPARPLEPEPQSASLVPFI